MIALLSLLWAQPALAEPFLGYQTNGVNLVYVTAAWRDGRPTLGVGYSRRFATSPTFTTAEVECHMPVATMWRFREYQLVLGVYKPLVARRASLGVGVHARVTRRSVGDTHTLRLGLAASAVPFYVYAAPLDDAPAGSAGGRATYEAVLAARTWTDGQAPSWVGLAAHRVEVGGHADLHLERTFTLGLNVHAATTWARKAAALETDGAWAPEGDVTLGSAYDLGRW